MRHYFLAIMVSLGSVWFPCSTTMSWKFRLTLSLDLNLIHGLNVLMIWCYFRRLWALQLLFPLNHRVFEFSTDSHHGNSLQIVSILKVVTTITSTGASTQNFHLSTRSLCTWNRSYLLAVEVWTVTQSVYCRASASRSLWSTGDLWLLVAR